MSCWNNFYLSLKPTPFLESQKGNKGKVRLIFTTLPFLNAGNVCSRGSCPTMEIIECKKSSNLIEFKKNQLRHESPSAYRNYTLKFTL